MVLELRAPRLSPSTAGYSPIEQDFNYSGKNSRFPGFPRKIQYGWKVFGADQKADYPVRLSSTIQSILIVLTRDVTVCIASDCVHWYCL